MAAPGSDAPDTVGSPVVTVSTPDHSPRAVSLLASDLGVLAGSGAELFYVWGPDGTLVWANQAGLAAADGSTVILSAAASAAPGSGVGPAVDPVRDRVGKQRWWLWSAWRADDGTLFLSATDVTNDHHSRRARQLRVDALRTLLGHRAPVITVKDPTGRIVLTNAGSRPVLSDRDRPDRPDRPEVPTQGDDPVVPLSAEEQRVLRAGVIDTVHEVVPSEAGDRNVVVVRFALRNDRGVVSHIASVAIDITDQIAAQRQQAQHQQLLETVIGVSPDHVALIDAAGHMTQIGDSAFRALGLEPSGHERDLLASLVPGDGRRLQIWLRDLVSGEPSGVLRVQATHRDGRLLTFDVSGCLVPAQGDVSDPPDVVLEPPVSGPSDLAEPADLGEPTAAVMILHDVTDRVRGEAELQRALAVAEEESRAKSELLMRMGAELQRPLDDVVRAAQTLHDARPAPPRAEAVAHIVRASGHLGALVREVVEVARRADRGDAVHMVPLSLDDVVDDAVTLARPLADAQGIGLSVTVPLSPDGSSKWPWVRADRQRLLQVLLNLLSNAIKYNRSSGTARVSVSTGAGRVRVDVADTGPGIDREHFDRIFEPFDRIGAERSAITGTGVGLTVTKRLVEEMGGAIEVASVVGVGSVFTVDLEMAPVPGGAGQAGGDLGQHHGASDPSGSAADVATPLRVLLVEDDPSGANPVRGVLEDHSGLRVVPVTTGAAGLTAAHDRPDVVVVDLGSPDEDAATVLRSLRSDPATAEVPVVMVNGGPAGLEVMRLLRTGIDAYLAKPFNSQALLAVMDDIATGGAR